MIKILIVDDHAVVRSGLRQFLANSDDLRITGEAGTVDQALCQLREKECDVVMVDIALNEESGLDLLTHINRIKPGLPVLIFSMHSEEEFALAAFKAGAKGYVEKANAAEEIIDAIRKVAAGVKYVGPRLMENLLAETSGQGNPIRHKLLSRREIEVMLYISQGVPLTEIARRIHLSVKTISTYRARILEKLQLKSNADVTRYVMRHGLSH